MILRISRSASRLALGAAMLLALTACQRAEKPVNFIADGKPEKLSDWGVVMAEGKRLSLNKGVVPYDMNTPLFTDYAHKLRTIWMPKGTSARYDAEDTFNFPVGTIISKTFYYPKGEGKTLLINEEIKGDYDGEKLDLTKVRLIETRLLVRRESGWVALPYVWNEDQTDAVLQRTGEQLPLSLARPGQGAKPLTYVVPNVNQCASCHVADIKSKQFTPLGPKARHLNREYTYGGVSENQIAYLMKVGYLSGAPAPQEIPKNARWGDSTASLDTRARSYLDVNCAHCHNSKGAANTTALHLQMGAPADRHLGLCKPPVAAGAGTGNRAFGIQPGQPDDSIMLYRIESTETGVMMPELGRTSAHEEGAALIRAWIKAMPAGCNS